MSLIFTILSRNCRILSVGVTIIAFADRTDTDQNMEMFPVKWWLPLASKIGPYYFGIYVAENYLSHVGTYVCLKLLRLDYCESF